MSKTPHSEHTEQGEPNCIACQRENEAELAAKEGFEKQPEEGNYVAYSAYNTPYAHDWNDPVNAWRQVENMGHGAVYVKLSAIPDLEKQLKTLGMPGIAERYGEMLEVLERVQHLCYDDNAYVLPGQPEIPFKQCNGCYADRSHEMEPHKEGCEVLALEQAISKARGEAPNG